MSRKHFSWLLALTVIVAVLALLMPQRTAHEPSVDNAHLLPELREQVNELDWLRFVKAGDKTVATLERGEDGWTVAEASAYRADWDRLKSLLSNLAEAEILEAKTSNPDYYDRLGVEDVAADDAAGTLILFSEDSGLPAVIIGKRATSREGQYARLEDQDRSVLVDREFDLPGEFVRWLDDAIVDIADAEVVEVDISHADGETVQAQRASADDEDFILENVPDGFEPKSAWSVNSLANNLITLSLEDVSPQDRIDWSGATRFRLLTADGLDVGVDLVAVDETVESAGEATGDPSGDLGEEESAEFQYWARIEAGIYTTAIDRPVRDNAAENATDGEGADSGAEGNGEAGAADAETRARAINDRVRGWAYRIPKYKYDAMTKRMDDLVQAVDPES